MKSAATVEAAVDQFLNAIGNVALIMFVTLMLTVLVPFRCLYIPTVPSYYPIGISSVRSFY